MELIVDFCISEKTYYIRLLHSYKNIISDECIARELGLDLDSYKQILFRWGGYMNKHEKRVIFGTQGACLNAREELDIYVIMNNLT